MPQEPMCKKKKKKRHQLLIKRSMNCSLDTSGQEVMSCCHDSALEARPALPWPVIQPVIPSLLPPNSTLTMEPVLKTIMYFSHVQVGRCLSLIPVLIMHSRKDCTLALGASAAQSRRELMSVWSEMSQPGALCCADWTLQSHSDEASSD